MTCSCGCGICSNNLPKICRFACFLWFFYWKPWILVQYSTGNSHFVQIWFSMIYNLWQYHTILQPNFNLAWFFKIICSQKCIYTILCIFDMCFITNFSTLVLTTCQQCVNNVSTRQQCVNYMLMLLKLAVKVSITVSVKPTTAHYGAWLLE